jgi:carboxyl-terminal processing protease
MKKILLILIILVSYNTSYSDNSNITVWKMFNFFAEINKWEIKQTYKYIDVHYNDINKWTKLEDSLKKLIYLDLIKNKYNNIWKNKSISKYTLYKISEKILNIKNLNIVKKNNTKANISDFKYIKDYYNNSNKELLKTTDQIINNKIKIFNDVYQTVLNWHYNKSEITKQNLLNSAIEWIAKGTKDKHTVYFPPVKNKNFMNILEWEYEWIWSYVEMSKPWILKIQSPIPGSPSEKAWLMGGDIVSHVDNKEITYENSLSEVVSWIKWPRGTNVVLTIIRWNQTLDITIKREKIIINDVEGKKINNSTYYIQIKSFWNNVDKNLLKEMNKIKQNNNIKKIIFDLRNNWWWYLHKVANILSNFIPKWQNTAIVKYRDYNKFFESKWYNIIELNNYKVIILQNSWTASASEIFIWTLTEYFSKIKTIWVKTYGKWSVQVIKPYSDWSSLKYTIAKWYTWKLEQTIDWVWIQPDIELKLDIEKKSIQKQDNQLQKAINLN